MCMCLGLCSQAVGLHSSLHLSFSVGVRLSLQVASMHCHLLSLLCF